MPSLLIYVANGALKVTEVGPNSAKAEVIIPVEAKQAPAGSWVMKIIDEAEENRKFSIGKLLSLTDCSRRPR